MSDPVFEAYELLVPAGALRTEVFAIAWANAAEAARTDVECRVWQIIDADGLAPVPSDMWEAVERIARAARNRDMWKAQCERQAQTVERLRLALRNIAEGNLGDAPWQANHTRVKQVAAEALANDAAPPPPPKEAI